MKGLFNMKKNIFLAIMLLAVMLSGCSHTADLIGEEVTPPPTLDITPFPTEEVEPPKTTIAISQTLKMTNDWTIMGDFDFSITEKGKKDRIVLATSAKDKNGEMMWDDSQYWTLAVIAEGGAYNLFNERMRGYVYAEVNEAFVHGLSTPVITLYIFSGNDREIRNYIFEEDVFVEYQEYSTKNFSTGGVNNRYSTLPEPKAK